MLTIVAIAAIAAWIYLVACRGGFWLAWQRDEDGPYSPTWPTVVAVVPARDEATGIGQTITSLLQQDYPGPFSIVVVDDQSSDGTADVARQAATSSPEQLTMISGTDLPREWSGKPWAMKQGVDKADESAPDYFLFTDADIVYAPETLTRLVALAQADGLVLNSLMVKLRCETFAERAFIPAFVFFFQMLYPFAWVSDRARRTAAAAGGCMLVRREALAAAGGIETIRGALIDDCALARALKPHGSIRLSLTERAHSIRSYPRMDDIRRMVARSAYTQLGYSPLMLAGMTAGMAVVYLAPALLSLFAHGPVRMLGLLAWAVMTISFLPILRFYRLAPVWAPALPLIALGYMAFTLESAYQYARKRGGLWKGRIQSAANGTR